MKTIENLKNVLSKAENSPNGNFKKDLIEAIRRVLCQSFQSTINDNGDLIIADNELEEEVLDCIFTYEGVQELTTKIGRTTKD